MTTFVFSSAMPSVNRSTAAGVTGFSIRLIQCAMYLPLHFSRYCISDRANSAAAAADLPALWL